MSRFFIDERVGCIAVQDKKYPKYDPTYPGLHFDTPDVIFYTHGRQEQGGWYIDERDIKKAKEVLEYLNSIIND
jgi:hypothetical protein